MVTVLSLPLTAFLLSWVVIEKVAPLAPAGTTTLRGTWAASGGSVANDTSRSKGATMSSVTVASTELPPTTLADPKARDESVGFSAALRPVHSKTMSHKTTTCLEPRIATPLGSKLENNVHHSRRIDRLTLMRRWLKPDLLGCLYASSSSPCPKPCSTRTTWTCPLVLNRTSSRTSPSIFSLRPSSVYSGFGLEKICTGVLGGPLMRLALGASGPAPFESNPDCWTTPPRSELPVATPSPKPELKTAPRLAPPDPLPRPEPPGTSNEPRARMLVASRLSRAGTPLG